MKITTTVTVEVERADGSYTKTIERREQVCGDNPSFEADECDRALTAAIDAINRRIEDRCSR